MIIEKLIQTDSSLYDTNFTDNDIKLFGSKIVTSSLYTNYSKYNLEIYSFNGSLLYNYRTTNAVEYITSGSSRILSNIDLTKHFNNANLSSGKYYISINAYNQVIGNYENNLFIQEISPSRTEIRLGRYIPTSNASNKTVGTANNISIDIKPVTFVSSSISESEYDQYLLTDFTKILTDGALFRNVFLTFNDVSILNRIINIEIQTAPTYEILVKLYEPLPDSINERDFCEINEILFSYGDVIEYNYANTIIEEFYKLKPANFDLEIQKVKSDNTDYQTWNDLLNVNLTTSQKIIDKYFSNNENNAVLNIDYSNPDEFIFYSSGENRFNNFYYKIQQIEQYNNELISLNSISQSLKTVNIVDITKKRNLIINKFDDFEKYLYFGNNSSSLYTFYSGSISPWPKNTTGSLNWLEGYNFWVDNYENTLINSNIGYNLLSTDNDITVEYINNTLAILKDYDNRNINNLLKILPSSLFLEESNSEFFIFINMIGHHFDTIYSYIKNLQSIYSRDEHPLSGTSKDLLQFIAESKGWSLPTPKKSSPLWSYITGQDNNGNVLQSGSISTISYEQYTAEIWKRIVNNLPYILKTKGTIRSIHALMNCYGIPSSVLSIKEYGNLNNSEHPPLFKADKFVYSLKVNNSTQSISFPWQNLNSTNDMPKTIQFRVKPVNDSIIYPRTLLKTDNLNNPNFFITYDRNADYEKLGNLNFYYLTGSNDKAYYSTASLTDIPMFNNEWTTIMLTRYNKGISDETYQITATVKNYDNIVYNKSSYITAPFNNFNSGSNIIIGSASFNTSNRGFLGSIQEFRYWSTALTTASNEEFSLNPLFFGGDNDIDAYNSLDYRIPLTYKMEISSSYLNSVHPNQDNRSFRNLSSSFALLNRLNTSSFIGEDYTLYIKTPYLGTDSVYSDKIRIATSQITGSLLVNKTIEQENNDNFQKDSNIISIFMSPQEIINNDIYNQLGYFNIDDYIGDPSDENKTYYTDLLNIQFQYWKKYKEKNNMPMLLKLLSVYDYTFFSQIRQLIPARVIPDVGITIKQNVLERSKLTVIDNVIVNNQNFEGSIKCNTYSNIYGDYNVYSGSLNSKIILESPGQYQFSQSLFISGSGFINTNVILQSTASIILNNKLSTSRQVLYPIYDNEQSASLGRYNTSSYYKNAEVQDYNYDLLRFRKINYEGTKISSIGYNVPSPDLSDGSPVISITFVQPQTIRNNPIIPKVVINKPIADINKLDPSNQARVNNTKTPIKATITKKPGITNNTIMQDSTKQIK